jgi:hypothetical protein
VQKLWGRYPPGKSLKPEEFEQVAAVILDKHENSVFREYVMYADILTHHRPETKTKELIKGRKEAAESFVQQYPNSWLVPEVYCKLFWTYLAEKDKAKAEQARNKALEKAPNAAFLRYIKQKDLSEPDQNATGAEVEVETSRAEVRAVIESLADELERIAAKYPELSDYRKDEAIQISEGDWRLSYSRNFTPPRAMRAVMPYDFGENGVYINFRCKAMAPPGSPKYAMPPPELTLRNLQLYLWAEVKTGAKPSPGLADEVQSLLDAHAEKLRQVAQEAATGAKVKAPVWGQRVKGLLATLADPGANAEGQRILRQVAEVNRYWLIRPPSEVAYYSYSLNVYARGGRFLRTENREIANAPQMDPGERQGVAYYSILNRMATNPSATIVTKIERDAGTIKLYFVYNDLMDMGGRNKIPAHLLVGMDKAGSLWLDAEKLVPLKLRAGYREERFTGYVGAGEERYVPLTIGYDHGTSYYDYKFSLYKPGLWLLESGPHGRDETDFSADLVGNVKINGEPAVKAETTAVEVAPMPQTPPVTNPKTENTGRFANLALSSAGITLEGRPVTWHTIVAALAQVRDEFPGLNLVAAKGVGERGLENAKLFMSFLSRQFRFDYLTGIGSGESQVGDLPGRYFLRGPVEFDRKMFIMLSAPAKFRQRWHQEEGRWVEDPNRTVKEWTGFYVGSIYFQRNEFSGEVTAKLMYGYDKWPVAKWQVTLEVFDKEGKSLVRTLQEVETRANVNIISGIIMWGSTDDITFSLGRAASIADAASFEITVVPRERDVEFSDADTEGGTAQDLPSWAAKAMNAGDLERAHALLAEAVKLDPDFAEAWAGMGMACVKVGDYKRAEEFYERALSLHQERYRNEPSNAGYSLQQIFLLALLGRDDEAKRLLSQPRCDEIGYSGLRGVLSQALHSALARNA